MNLLSHRYVARWLSPASLREGKRLWGAGGETGTLHLREPRDCMFPRPGFAHGLQVEALGAVLFRELWRLGKGTVMDVP